MPLSALLKDSIRSTSAHFNKLQKMGITTVKHLFEYFPRTIESTEIISDYANIRLGEKNTLSGELVDIRKEKTSRGKVLVKAALMLGDHIAIEVVWFQVPYVLKNLKENSSVFLMGMVKRDYGKVQIVNPEVHLGAGVHVGTLRAIYPESPPITSKWIREKLKPLVDEWADLFEEYMPPEILKEQKLIDYKTAIKNHTEGFH